MNDISQPNAGNCRKWGYISLTDVPALFDMHFKTLVLTSAAVTALYFGESMANPPQHRHHRGQHPPQHGQPPQPGFPNGQPQRFLKFQMEGSPYIIVHPEPLPLKCFDQCGPYLKQAYMPCIEPRIAIKNEVLVGAREAPTEEEREKLTEQYNACLCKEEHKPKAANCYECVQHENKFMLFDYLNDCKFKKEADLLKHVSKDVAAKAKEQHDDAKKEDGKPAKTEEQQEGKKEKNNAGRLALGMSAGAAVLSLLLL